MGGAALADDPKPLAAPDVTAVAAALREALAEADPAKAAEGFAEVAAQAPVVADHAEELRIEALLGAGLFEEGLAAAQAFEADPGDSSPWLRARVASHEGALQVALGDEPAARQAFARAEAGLDVAEQARLEAEIAASWERSGDTAQAVRHWQEVYTRYATDPVAARAEQELVRLDPALGFRTPEALRERCDRLSDALLNEAALVACDEALAVLPGDRELLRERAMLLFRMRRYPEAVVAFEGLGPNDRSARFWRARSLARSGRIEASIEAFDQLAAVAEPELAARARFLAGTLHEDDDLAKADASYRRVAESAPLATQRSDAQWRLAWLAWRAGDWARARTAFTRYLTDEREPEGLQRGRYWRARTLLRAGDAAGEQELAELAREAPFTYYGWRAASRESEKEDAPSVATPGDAEVASAPPSLAPPPALPPALLRRLEILLAAGLDERAAREVRPLAGRAASLSTRLALGQLLLEAGQFQRAQRLVMDAHRAELTGAPTPGGEALWWLAWPTAFDQAVEPAAAANGIPAALVYAIMREESGYQPGALSVVGARGLTQIMPETGRRLARDLGAARFDPDELFVPERNLELGAFYLARLVDRFDGRLSAAIASYNAGPEAVARWLESGAELEDDEWVEAIPYEQTRGYVKRVLRSLHAYRTLYDT